MTDTSTVFLTKQRVVDFLSEKLITNVTTSDPDDPTKAGLVRIGRLQEDPTVRKISLLVREAFQQRPHRIKDDNDNPIKLPTPYEIGSDGAWWWYKFTLDVEVYFIGTATRLQADERANVFWSRTRYWLKRVPLNGLEDSFGNFPMLIQVRESEKRDGGGPPQSFIHRGEIQFEVLAWEQ